jgi:putative nucleotidyltransferase with HDIG domain
MYIVVLDDELYGGKTAMTIVPTGEMKITRSGKMKAFLGSCVGLAIFDSKKGIGGLHHILLPEPICSIPDSQLSYYASTGIPIFLQAFVDMGSKREDLSAFIAGGALIDPNCSKDLALNIGGRTLEITLKILKNVGIPIKLLETSGLTPFCIMLDANSGSCTIEPIIPKSNNDLDTIKKPDLSDINKTLEQLQSVPQIALGIVGMISDDCDIASIAKEIRKDQVLSAKILMLCNSSYLGMARKIDSIDQAVTFLGDKTLLQLTITAQTERLLNSSDKGYSLTRGGLYYHVLATARLCEKLSFRIRKIQPDLAYTAGLLHDIGKVVLDQYLANAKPLFYRMMIERKEDARSIEQKVFGIDHNHAGLMLAENWDLPQVIKDVTLFHHCPEKADSNADVVHLVYLADAITQKFLPGFIIENLDTASLKESMQVLSITSQDIRNSLSVLADIF